MYFNNRLTSLSEGAFLGCSRYNERSGFDLSNIKTLGRIGDFKPFYAYNIDHRFNAVQSSAFMNLAVAKGKDGQ